MDLSIIFGSNAAKVSGTVKHGIILWNYNLQGTFLHPFLGTLQFVIDSFTFSKERDKIRQVGTKDSEEVFSSISRGRRMSSRGNPCSQQLLAAFLGHLIQIQCK